MDDNGVFEITKLKDLNDDDVVLSSTWAMKKKSNGTYRARINARGFEQKHGVHYDRDTKAAPVVNDITINMVMIMIVIGCWYAHLIDVKGAFLKGDFDPKHRMFMAVPQGFEKWYPENVVLRLVKRLYGTNQAAYQFWIRLLACMKLVVMSRNDVDSCLYFKWTENGLVMV